MKFFFTPDKIGILASNEVFVYGANEAGIHGAGAAKLALKWGAKIGAYGFNGRTYGIPTKSTKIKTLPRAKIGAHVDEFLLFAIEHPDHVFLVTQIGCGLAGFKVRDMAPLFRRALLIKNIVLPESFFRYLILEQEQMDKFAQEMKMTDSGAHE